MKARLYFAVVLAMFTSPVRHASADDKANFSKMVSDPTEQQQVLKAAKLSGVVVNSPCPSANFTILNQFQIYKPLVFDGSGHPMDGAWKQSVAQKGCGQDRVLNVVFWLDPNTHAVNGRPLFPGTTRSDPTLQKDAMPFAGMAARWPEKDCKTGYVETTEFLAETGTLVEGAKGKPWDELWTLTSCTKVAKVTLHFVPDSTGTTIHSSFQETKFFAHEPAR